MTCRAKNVSLKRGLDCYLPVFESIPNDNMVWKDKEVKRAKVAWDLKNCVKLVIKKEPAPGRSAIYFPVIVFNWLLTLVPQKGEVIQS